MKKSNPGVSPRLSRGEACSSTFRLLRRCSPKERRGKRRRIVTNHPSESARGLAGDTGGTFDSQDHMPLLIDADEAAAELSLGARTLWTLTNSNAIPSRKIRAVASCSIGSTACTSPGAIEHGLFDG